MKWKPVHAGALDTHIPLRVVGWHEKVCDHHVGDLDDAHVKPLVLLL